MAEMGHEERFPQRRLSVCCGWRLCENASSDARLYLVLGWRGGYPLSSPHCCHQRGRAEDGDCPLQVVREDVEAHLGSNIGQPSGPEVVSPHPALDRTERMLD